MNIKRPGSIIIVSTGAHLRYVLISATAHTQVSRSLICCSLASLSSADSVHGQSVPHLLQPGLSLFSWLGGQSFMLASAHLLQPGLSLSSTDLVASWSLICCSLASHSSANSVASRSLICGSLASLSSADSVASRSLICCSLASLSSANSVASRSRLCCRSDCLRSTVWAARLAQSLILRLLSRSSRCTAVSESRRSLSRSRLHWRSLLSLLSVSDSGVRGAEARRWFVAEARWWFVELILQTTNVERYTATVERYSKWLETDSEVGRCKHVGDFLSTSWSSCGLTRHTDDGRTTIIIYGNRPDVRSMWGSLRLAPIILTTVMWCSEIVIVTFA